MPYRFKTDADPIAVGMEMGHASTMRITSDMGTREVRYARISEHQIHLVVDGIGMNAFVVGRGDGEKEVVIKGVAYHLQEADRAGPSAKSHPGRRAVAREVTPPMPSVIERLMVAEGELVHKGDGVVVVSAMKMETTLMAPFDGRVTKINVSVGDKVMPGQILVDIARESPDGAG